MNSLLPPKGSVVLRTRPYAQVCFKFAVSEIQFNAASGRQARSSALSSPLHASWRRRLGAPKRPRRRPLAAGESRGVWGRHAPQLPEARPSPPPPPPRRRLCAAQASAPCTHPPRACDRLLFARLSASRLRPFRAQRHRRTMAVGRRQSTPKGGAAGGAEPSTRSDRG